MTTTTDTLRTLGHLAAAHELAEERYRQARYHRAGGSDGVEVSAAAREAAEADPEVARLRAAYEVARDAEAAARAAI
jgi:hypothetical protein